MKKYAATIYQLQDALETAEKLNHIDVVFALQQMVAVLQARINFGDDTETQELM